MMSDTEIDELAKDIGANGLREEVVLWRREAHRHGDPTPLLDGRNRLEALTRLGATINPGLAVLPGGRMQRLVRYYDGEEPAAYVISLNLRRRHLHLTKEQQAELIVKTIEAGQIDGATVARSFNTTNGKKGGSTKDPVLTAAVEEGKKHGIGKRAVQNARAKLHGKDPAPRKKIGTPKAHADPIHARTVEPAFDALRDLQNELTTRVPPQVHARLQAVAGVIETALQGYVSTLHTADRLIRMSAGVPLPKAEALVAQQLIDKGYKALARELHPDVGGNSEGMARVNTVHAVLKQFITLRHRA
jgi:hypothetical protein